MVRLIAILAVAFKIWMFVDAVRQRRESHWLWIIMVVPGGAWAYLFFVKLRDRQVKELKSRMLEALKGPPPLEDLRFDYQKSPSVANHVRLAQGLYDAGELRAASTHFEQILADDPANKDGLYGLGMCLLELGDPAAAVGPLAELVEAHPRYRDYAAWKPLAQAHFDLSQPDEAVALLEDLVARAPRMAHQVLLAKALLQVGRADRARSQLRDALEEHRRAPRHIRRQDRPAAAEARKLLR